MDDDGDTLDMASNYEIASLIVEACDRIKSIHSAVPGAVATAAIELDDVRFRIQVSIEAGA